MPRSITSLLLFALGGGRPVLRASSRDPSDLGDARRASLRALGIRQARMYSPGEYFWSAEGGLTVWSRERMLADGRDGVLEVGNEALIRKVDAKRVVSFLDEGDDGHRGVAVDLRDGKRVVVVEEHDPSASSDPTYGMDNLSLDSAWATFLGRDLAAWLGVEHEDQLP